MKIIGIEKRQAYILLSVDCNSGQEREMTRWCTANECGKRVSIRTFAFKDDTTMSMFTMRWILGE